MSKDTNVIIVNYNTRELTRQCLESLRERFGDAIVQLVDNASRDDSVEMVQDEFPEVQCIPLHDNVRFGGANNIAYRADNSKYVILLNSDTVIEDDSLCKCIEYLEQNPDVGAVSPRLIGVDDQSQLAQHPFPSLSNIVRVFLRLESDYEKDIPQENSWLAGTCLVLRREAVDQVGGLFDPDLFMYWEDCDLSTRLFNAGWKLRVVEDAYIRHYGGASGGGADSARRTDLHQWYVFGRHHWFRKHKSFAVYAAVYAMEVLNGFRTIARGIVRKKRRFEIGHARAAFNVLWLRLTGRKPQMIGTSS
jgi:N-acetylglucosaminyl-diphospho-decaprenol L-rhamnosyltransferase